MSEVIMRLFLLAFLNVAGFYLGWLFGDYRGYVRGRDQTREIWDPYYKPITLKRKEYEAFKEWQKLQKK